VPKLAADFTPHVERLLSAFGREIVGEAGRLLVERCVAFAVLVTEWNERVDLTAAREPDDLVDLLLADAAAMLRDRPAAKDEEWLDVGSGVGAPGVALALLDPSLRMKLVEPRAKRVAFLRTLLHTIGRLDVAVERARSETISDRFCDVAVSRATLPPRDWLREGGRLARREVWLLLAREDPPDASGWKPERTIEYQWPLTQKPRRAVCYRRNLSSSQVVKF